MKKYYIIGSIAAVAIFLITIMVIGIASCVMSNNFKNEIADIESNVVILRYYTDDDYDNAEIIYMQIMDKDNYKIDKIPNKQGYIFSGLYDGTDYKTSTQYVDSNGYNLVSLTKDILLYPIFVKEK